MRRGDLQQPLARADAAMAAWSTAACSRGPRSCRRRQRPRVRIAARRAASAARSRAAVGRPLDEGARRAARRCCTQLVVAEAPRAASHFSVRSQPSQPCPVGSMPMRRSARHTGAVAAVFDAAGHSGACATARHERSPVSCGDVIPVRVVRQHEDHRVVRGAAAERRGARIEHAVRRRRYLGSRAWRASSA